MRDSKERLLDILQAINAVERYGDRDRTVFERDEMLQVWFLRHLQIIGMRDILVHGYFEIDTDIVWNAVQRDLPLLEPAIERLLKKMDELEHDR